MGGLVANPSPTPFPSCQNALISLSESTACVILRDIHGVLPWSGFLLKEDPLRSAAAAGASPLDRYSAGEMPEPGSLSAAFPGAHREGLRLECGDAEFTTLMATEVIRTTDKDGAPLSEWYPGSMKSQGYSAYYSFNRAAANFWDTLFRNIKAFLPTSISPENHRADESQATELRLGESERRATLLFNGADEVALYEGIDLTVEY